MLQMYAKFSLEHVPHIPGKTNTPSQKRSIPVFITGESFEGDIAAQGEDLKFVY